MVLYFFLLINDEQRAKASLNRKNICEAKLDDVDIEET